MTQPREQLEADVLEWYSNHLAPRGVSRSIKLARVGERDFRLAIDIETESERSATHDAFADWWTAHSAHREIRLHWLLFAETQGDQIARREFFRDFSGRTLPVPLAGGDAAGVTGRSLVSVA
ncbi:MAG: hypothetical protein ACT4PL_07990 [Phycisphaerales bacterium]